MRLKLDSTYRGRPSSPPVGLHLQVMIRGRTSVARLGGGVNLDASAKSPALVQRCRLYGFDIKPYAPQHKLTSARTEVRS